MQAIIDALRSGTGHITCTAALLGISSTILWRKIAKYGLK